MPMRSRRRRTGRSRSGGPRCPGWRRDRREDGDAQGRAGLPGRRQLGARGALGPGRNQAAGARQRPRHLDQSADEDSPSRKHRRQHAHSEPAPTATARPPTRPRRAPWQARAPASVQERGTTSDSGAGQRERADCLGNEAEAGDERTEAAALLKVQREHQGLAPDDRAQCRGREVGSSSTLTVLEEGEVHERRHRPTLPHDEAAEEC